MRLIDAYGADPARWPEDERAAAERHLADDPSARAALEEARRLDALLGRLPAPPEAPSIALPMALPAQRRPALQRLLHVGRGATWSLWPRFAALAMASVLGVLIGLSNVGDQLYPAQEGDTTTSVFDSAPSGGWDL
jgi:ferric-dicitrate binding protein FerR (iron transport regulator)